MEVENGFSGGKASHKSMTEITRNLSKQVTRLQDIGTSMDQEQQNVKAVESLGITANRLGKEIETLSKLKPTQSVAPAGVEKNEEMENQNKFMESVWDSSADIAKSVLTLIRAATEAQAAIDATHRVCRFPVNLHFESLELYAGYFNVCPSMLIY